ncbi:PQQ-binding-like beta-propeller repeat protein [Opitutia bacterium ISCC 51]|nr:PQQ-binding-like beta-propeller repeat protein [Opitutae bacterium ISCC 51]QXD29150.1 PQQ-binding-like beta-propeller repeat protein [Opitutae bacterium ISCC 52]
MKQIFLPLIFLLSFSFLAAKQSSNRFRGPDGAGIYSAPELPASWSEDDYKWTIELPGDGHSSPIIWDDQLYVTSSDGGQPDSLLLCLNKETGKELWSLQFEASDRKLHQFNTFASATPAVDEHHVYIAWSDADRFQIAAVNHDGKGAWQRDLGKHNTQHGGGISPIVFENMVLIGNDCRGPSALHALDRMTGETIWSVDRPWDPKGKTSYSTPLLYTGYDGETQVIFNSASSGMTALDPRTGKLLWQVPDLFPQRTISSPMLAGGLIFASCGAGNAAHSFVAVRPPSGPNQEAEVAYKIRKSAPYVPTPVAKGDQLFLVSDGGIATCIDAPTGNEIWKGNLRDTFFSSPIQIDDRILAVSRRADVVTFKVDDSFEILGRTLINQPTHATPIVDNERLYLRTVSHLYCLE